MSVLSLVLFLTSILLQCEEERGAFVSGCSQHRRATAGTPFLLPLPLSPCAARSPLLVLQFLHGRGQKELNVQMVQTMKIGLKDQNKGLFSIWQEIFQLPRVQR